MFSRKTLESLIPKLLRAELVCKQIGKNSYFTWAMFKAAEDLKRNPDQIFTGLVATRDATRPYIVAVVDGYGFHCMVQSRPSDPAELPIAGTPIKIRLTEILPHQNLASAEWVTV
ncbi:hypothetical protein EV182_005849 [Spiromyces aspiralis]|uniref:Uncharacterized protein n=1 Tax=Spiromyces aspiralis TaxID=68401 RepID=A0ACC1H9P8_9FUNG|nr:hypothetical protein EV182_005849 [Spiromyces aspiralis]